MSRFAADGWEPNLRITPRTRSDCRAMFPIFFITNCIRRKKMAKLVERNYVTGDRTAHPGVERRTERAEATRRYFPTSDSVLRTRVYNPNRCNSYEIG